MSSNIETKLDELVKNVTERNKEIQTQKESVPWGTIMAIILALISFIATAYATYLANKRAKELADARTELEQLKVECAQKEHEGHVAKEKDKQETLVAEARLMAAIIKNREDALHAQEATHADRQKKLAGLRSWEEINDA